jgi:hypothetical protein
MCLDCSRIFISILQASAAFNMCVNKFSHLQAASFYKLIVNNVTIYKLYKENKNVLLNIRALGFPSRRGVFLHANCM